MGGVRVWRQALLVLLAWCPPSRVLSQDLSALPVGCFSYGYKFYPALPNISGMPFTVNNVIECQQKCRMTRGCFHFAYFSTNGQCWLGDLRSKTIRALTKGVICGPAYCPEKPASCVDIPGPDFPATTDAASRAAWPGGEQPTNLQCWPRKSTGFPARCHSRMATVLEDTAAGWPGRCDNMRRIDDLQPGETCQLRCFNSALCGVWSLENVSQNGQATCWHGLRAMNCVSGSSIQPMRAQRVMHGAFRVLMNTMGMQIMNLTLAFDTTGIATVKDGIRACRKTCLSYLFCQFWQYSTVWGCWVEDPVSKRTAYPLVNNGKDMITEVDSSNTVRAGEYIQHFCADEPAVPLPTDSPSTGAVATPQTGRAALAGASNNHKTLDGHDVPAAAATASREVEGLNGPSAGGVAGGPPMWASILIGVAIATCLGVVGLVVWVTVIESDKRGTRGSKYGAPGQHFGSHMSSGQPFGSHMSSGSSRTGSFASESQPFMQQGSFGVHMPQSGHWQNQAVPPQSHSFIGQAAQWMNGGQQPGYGQVQPQQPYYHGYM